MRGWIKFELFYNCVYDEKKRKVITDCRRFGLAYIAGSILFKLHIVMFVCVCVCVCVCVHACACVCACMHVCLPACLLVSLSVRLSGAYLCWLNFGVRCDWKGRGIPTVHACANVHSTWQLKQMHPDCFPPFNFICRKSLFLNGAL
jgi:hypothetical protein